ncbi:MAG: hypothetical protein K9H61_11300, partial [Bacteroidia bacterium]|nr:hypothetical protein [Bacteroidia bacterium]
MKKISIILLGAAITMASCKKSLEDKYNSSNPSNPETSLSVEKMSDIKVPAGFNWKTTEKRLIKVSLKDNRDNPVEKQKVVVSTILNN